MFVFGIFIFSSTSTKASLAFWVHHKSSTLIPGGTVYIINGNKYLFSSISFPRQCLEIT